MTGFIGGIKMLKIKSKIRLESLDGSDGINRYEKFVGKDAIVLRNEIYDTYIVDVNGEELCINLDYDEIFDYESGQFL